MFLIILILLCSLNLSSSVFDSLDNDLFLVLSKRIIDNLRGIDNFPGFKETEKSDLPKIYFLNGAMICPLKKKFLVMDLFRLSLTCNKMQLLFKETKAQSDAYWFETRQLCVLDIKKEISLQNDLGFDCKPLTFFQIYQYFNQISKHYRWQDFVSSQGDFVNCQQLFDLNSSIAIGIQIEALYNYFFDFEPTHSFTKQGICEFFCNSFFKGKMPSNQEIVKLSIGCVIAGLFFFLPKSTFELNMLQERYSKFEMVLKNYFKSEKELSNNNENNLKGIDDSKFDMIFDFKRKTTWLYFGVQVLIDFFKLTENLCAYEKTLFNGFCDEKKLILFHFKAQLNFWQHFPLESCGFYFIYVQKCHAFKFGCNAIKNFFKDKYKDDAIAFFDAISSVETTKKKIKRIKLLGKFISILLNMYDVSTFFKFFENICEVEERLTELIPAFYNLSFNDIAVNFHYLLKDDWKSCFQIIADSKFQKESQLDKLCIELTEKEIRIEKLKNKNELDKERLQAEYNQQLSNYKQEASRKIKEIQDKNSAEIQKMKKEQSVFIKKICKIFFGVQLCVFLILYGFFKYITYSYSSTV